MGWHLANSGMNDKVVHDLPLWGDQMLDSTQIDEDVYKNRKWLVIFLAPVAK